MRKIAWLSLWPGLAALWLRGSTLGLATAAVFAVALNFALITTFVWPQMLSRWVSPWVTPAAAWVLVLWFWIMAARSAAKILAHEKASQMRPDNEANRLLVQAQTEYLKGRMSQAECLLKELLADHPGDCEAQLLLATLCRRSGRKDDAGKHLRELIDLPHSQVWKMEIEIEQQNLTRPAGEDDTAHDSTISPSRAAA